RIGGNICRKYRFALVGSAPTRADTRTDAYAIHKAIVSFRHAGRRSVAQALRRFIKDQRRAHHSVTRLRFDATYQDIEHCCKRCSRCDFFQNSFLVAQRVLRALALRDIAKTPNTTNSSLLDQLNCRMLLENATVL